MAALGFGTESKNTSNASFDRDDEGEENISEDILTAYSTTEEKSRKCMNGNTLCYAVNALLVGGLFAAIVYQEAKHGTCT